MKFKKHKFDPDRRDIRLVDKGGVTLEVTHYDDSNPLPVLFTINDNEANEDVFGLSRAKALKLAYAIISELETPFSRMIAGTQASDPSYKGNDLNNV
jgi:hypothetical protein